LHVDSQTFKNVNVTLKKIMEKNTGIDLEALKYFMNDLIVILKTKNKIISILDFLLNLVPSLEQYVKVKCNLFKIMIVTDEYESVLIAILRDVELFVKLFNGKDFKSRIDMIVEI
jgi:hypothetical protein